MTNITYFRRKPFVRTFGLSLLLIFVHMLFFSESAYSKEKATLLQQTIQVTGQVKDQKGEALPGVIVSVRGSRQSVVTDKNGHYTINKLNKNSTLVFSLLGFETQEQTVGNTKVINITLKETVTGLDEVVVIGYGEVDRKDLTGSVGSVNIEQMAQAPVMSFDQALAGRVAGVQVSSAEGQPGEEGISIVIRGANSLTQDNSPLFVVDGFPMEDFEASSLNPEEIASMDILKDASATAIYGARGANGVIIIETKKGQEGRPTVTFNTRTGINKITNRMEMMTPYEFVRLLQERSQSAADRYYLGDHGLELEDYQNVRGIDWQDQILQTAPAHLYNLALRGGTRQTKYSISGSVNDMTGVIINSGQKRYQGRISLDQQINNKLKANLNANFSSGSSYGAYTSSSSSAASNYMYAVWAFRPLRGAIEIDEFGNIIEDDEGFLEDEFGDEEPSVNSSFNPILNAQNTYRTRRDNTLNVNGSVDYAITKALTFRVNGGIKQFQRRSETFYNSSTMQGNPRRPNNIRGQYGSVGFSETTTWLNENILRWKKRINKQHNLDVLGGFTLQGVARNNYGYSSQFVPNEELGMSGLDEGVPYSASASISDHTLASFLGRVNYNYKWRYLFTASFRADGSSKFSARNRWSYFPSGAFAWRMDREAFIQDIPWISESKLRVSFGYTGNNRVGDFSYLPAITLPISFAYPFNNATPERGGSVSAMGNPDLRWESTSQLDIGYDVGFFDSRLNLTVDVYRKTTSDLLLNANVPYYTGFSTVYRNIGKIQNQGLEITLNTVNIKNRDFEWRSNFNISFNRNKILQLADNENNMLSMKSWQTGFNETPLYMAKIGQPAAVFYGYVFDGIYQFEDFDQTPSGSYILKNDRPDNGDPRNLIQPGDVRYKDLDGDGTITDGDRTVIGRTLPIHMGGFSNDFRYKNLTLNVFFQWSYGNHIYNANREIFEGNRLNSIIINQFASYVDRWQPDNPSNTLFRVGGRGPAGTYSSRVIEDGSFLRLKTVSLAYRFNPRYLHAIRLSGLELNAAAQNLFTWTNYSGMDPEVSVRHSVLAPGFDFSAYPRAKTLVFGLKATF